MKKIVRQSIVFALFLVLVLQSFAFAATASQVQKIRFSQASDKVRLVLEIGALPDYTVDASTAGEITIDLPSTTLTAGAALPAIKDKDITAIRWDKAAGNHLKLTISFTDKVTAKVFSLANPNRLVIDLLKSGDKTVTTVAPGLTYTHWLRNEAFGPVETYVVEADLAKYNLRPVLSNTIVPGLEAVSDMAERNQAVAAINGSYFAPNGEIIGLLKLNDTIVSIPYITRTALAITTDNKLVFDQVDYQGSIRLPDKRTLAINGINCERGEDAVTLYNSYYGSSTKTNEFGREYVVTNGKITAISPQDTNLVSGSVVLSAHGTAAKAMESLKVGDVVTIEQSLGDVFNKAPFAIGAGPTLVRDGKVFLTTTAEEFPDDIAIGRAPRTALGVTKDNHVLLVVVDGRHASKGYTLGELANFMKELGAVDAMNFDGGGSSDMVVKDEVKNKPSDGQERLVGDALILVPKK
ncbi:MAG: phosphodiester glycosidase family protein [Sporomusaceae bacterium]|nr:phosphodiester glycosidase family protein [Sporomusaceae bacterium]